MIIVTACLLALWLPDQTAVRYTATIAVPEAELRAGPSNDTKLYTNHTHVAGGSVTRTRIDHIHAPQIDAILWKHIPQRRPTSSHSSGPSATT